ncbi:MAG: NAD(P)H-hydrate dehydratase [Thermoproteota archaeon]|nr:NAD(P)H-hydrate dehydratase [Thermoproteota archaeon]
MPSAITVTPKLIRQLMPPRSSSSRKGDNGTVLVAGGSRFYHGAPVLATMAALRSGADLVYTAVPRSIITEVRSFSPAIIALPLPDDKLTIGSANRLVAMLPKNTDSACVGMGMSLDPEGLATLVRKLRQAGTKIVLDASALIPQIVEEISDTGIIVTPHIGEYKRLFGCEPGSTTEEMISNVHSVAKERGIVIVLKGSVNIISDGEQIAAIKRSTPAMTVGGTGDVLSGLAAGLLTKMKPFDAAVVAIYVNGNAGALAFKQAGLHIIATDLIDNLPTAMKKFDKIGEMRK